MDLANTYLFGRRKVTKADGSNLITDNPVGPVNTWLHSLFSKVEVYLNDTLVMHSTNTYRVYMETALRYGSDAKETQLTSQLWYKDTTGRMDSVALADDTANAGFKSRRNYTTLSQVVEMMGRLHVDMFLQDRFLLNGVDVNIRLVRSKDAFALMAGGVNHTYIINIVDASVFARKATLSTAERTAHIKALDKGTAKYLLRPIDCKVYTIPHGAAMSHTHENLFLGTLPKRLVLCYIDKDAFNGSYAKNPFHAKNNNINLIAVYVYVDRYQGNPYSQTLARVVTSGVT